jgi:FAD:protein FMN transferase
LTISGAEAAVTRGQHVHGSPAAALPLLLCLIVLASCQRSPPELVFQGPTMGTTYTIKVAHPPPGADRQRVAAGIASVLGTIDLALSTYRPDAALAKFNASDSTDWFDVPPDLARVVAAARDVSTETDGAFDVTVGPLVNLWGFGPQGERTSPPDEAAIATARARVGYRELDVRLDPPALRKHRGDMYVDLNAIAPGYAVDRLAATLEAFGCTDYMVELGGEIRARGRNLHDESWRIAVERPEETLREVYTVIGVEAGAVATSGDYRHFFTASGHRYSHTLDPRTARPVEHALASVTVVEGSATTADALATALEVLGPDAGLGFVESRGIAALFLVRDGDRIIERSTPDFDRLRVIEGS